jgi:hypothetical protein
MGHVRPAGFPAPRRERGRVTRTDPVVLVSRVNAVFRRLKIAAA